MRAMPATQQRMTAEEYLALPELPSARRQELIEGEVVVTEPTWLHSTVARGTLRRGMELGSRGRRSSADIRVPI